MKQKQTDWENTFFNVYGKRIVDMQEELYRLRNPVEPQGNIGFESGMDFQGMIKDFIHFLLSQREEEIKREIIEYVCQLLNDELQREYSSEKRSRFIGLLNMIKAKYTLSLLAGKGKNSFEEYIEKEIKAKPELREKLRKAEVELESKELSDIDDVK